MRMTTLNSLPATGFARHLAGLVLALILAVALVPAPASAQEEISLDTFVEELRPYGNWVEHPRHGLVWYPRNVDTEWRPYSIGSWVFTEEFGWTWESDEPWGWATYHYGRWDHDDRYGWIWVPGEEWGPAWVEWRHGDGYIGWAPLPPAARWHDGAIHYTERFDFDAPRYRVFWIFVPERRFVDRHIHHHIVPRTRAVVLMPRTRVVTNYVFERPRRTIINLSIDRRRIETVTRVPVRVVTVQRVDTLRDHMGGRDWQRRDGRGRDGRDGDRRTQAALPPDTLRLFRPNVRPQGERPKPQVPAVLAPDRAPVAGRTSDPQAGAAPKPGDGRDGERRRGDGDWRRSGPQGPSGIISGPTLGAPQGGDGNRQRSLEGLRKDGDRPDGDRQRQEAERLKAVQERQRLEAERQKQDADRQRQALERQRLDIDRQRQETDRQRAFEVERQRQSQERHRFEAERQQRQAQERQRQEALRQQYQSQQQQQQQQQSQQARGHRGGPPACPQGQTFQQAKGCVPI